MSDENFWALSDGSNAAVDAQTEYEAPGGGFEPIPNNTNVLAMIDEAKWDKREMQGEPPAAYISLRWTVLQPEAYKNRKIFQKLWVTDNDPNAKDKDAAKKKRDRAKKMLAAIDKNAGSGLARDLGFPTDQRLAQHLCNKPMVIKVLQWSMPDSQNPGEKIVGNWVAAISPASAEISKAPPPKPLTTQAQDMGLDDDIPF